MNGILRWVLVVGVTMGLALVGQAAAADIAHGEQVYAANCVARDGRVLCAAGFPKTSAALAAAGFQVRTLDLSEIRKGDGSITCLSVRVD